MTQISHLPERAPTSDAQQLTDVVTRLRRALRTSIRTEYPWESLPMAQVELLMALADHAPAKIGRLAELQRLAPNTVSGLVQQLVESGLASRETDPADRRVARNSRSGRPRMNGGSAVPWTGWTRPTGRRSCWRCPALTDSSNS